MPNPRSRHHFWFQSTSWSGSLPDHDVRLGRFPGCIDSEAVHFLASNRLQSYTFSQLGNPNPLLADHVFLAHLEEGLDPATMWNTWLYSQDLGFRANK